MSAVAIRPSLSPRMIQNKAPSIDAPAQHMSGQKTSPSKPITLLARPKAESPAPAATPIGGNAEPSTRPGSTLEPESLNAQQELGQANGDAAEKSSASIWHPTVVDAVRKQKDRVWVLKFEKEMEAFVQESSRDSTEYPDLNSYYRLLAHNIAEAFKLTHIYDSHRNAVIITKSPASTIPKFSLRDIPLTDDQQAASEPVVEQSQQPVVLPKAIMRREDKSRPGARHHQHGHVKKADPPKTREQREQEYEEARKRIFNDDASADSSSQESAPKTPSEPPVVKAVPARQGPISYRPPRSAHTNNPASTAMGGAYPAWHMAGERPGYQPPFPPAFGMHSPGPAPRPAVVYPAPAHYNPGFRPPQHGMNVPTGLYYEPDWSAAPTASPYGRADGQLDAGAAGPFFRPAYPLMSTRMAPGPYTGGNPAWQPPGRPFFQDDHSIGAPATTGPYWLPTPNRPQYFPDQHGPVRPQAHQNPPMSNYPHHPHHFTPKQHSKSYSHRSHGGGSGSTKGPNSPMSNKE
ncbi:uncharacterized protein BJ171DRAFT_510903 [Polychytrium aggregatum]|uniref:uncharacterized protein n=1 Tax=Polychytrium aggregatum TaxID=110093 RepID=UPI0022FE365F|nr:uncharacterized protein BJ171DRAFT_510903 [Polychytrium aggregatum]KAI9203108.1 hypothetical protein BJ171DRAFT_510903 [Polychytrium aggregatum]